MSTKRPQTSDLFFKIALDYYVNGRAACLSGCVFTTGNLLHHAVEMMLKGELSQTIPLKDLKANKLYGHSLPSCWAAFKALFPSENLAEFDPMMSELDKFEHIRYPDNILKEGAGIGFGFGRWKPTNDVVVNTVPEYRMAIGDVDAFFARVFRLCNMNIKVYFSFLTAEGREMLTKYNEEAKDRL